MGPLVVIRRTGAHLAVPIERESYLVELLTIVVDICHCRNLRMLACLDSILLCRQSISVITHRVKHVVSTQTLVAGIDVAGDITERMANMQSRSRGIREHIEYVELLAFRVFSDFVGLLLNPFLTPLLFDFSKVVFHFIFVFYDS